MYGSGNSKRVYIYIGGRNLCKEVETVREFIYI